MNDVILWFCWMAILALSIAGKINWDRLYDGPTRKADKRSQMLLSGFALWILVALDNYDGSPRGLLIEAAKGIVYYGVPVMLLAALVGLTKTPRRG
jgi:hypothetical protein